MAITQRPPPPLLSVFDMAPDPSQSPNIASDNPIVEAEIERLLSEWWRGWCTGPNAVSDPMLAQIPDFSYFPPEQMFARLASLGRQDQIEYLERQLWVERRRIASQPHPEPWY